jgi:hypothetical protein
VATQKCPIAAGLKTDFVAFIFTVNCWTIRKSLTSLDITALFKELSFFTDLQSFTPILE